MGLFSWIFGRNREVATTKIEPTIATPLPRKFANGRFKPAGDWVQTTMAVNVSGISHRFEAAMAFAEAARRAEACNEYYGIQLQPEPDNQFDDNAIAVYGIADHNSWHVGYLDKHTAQEVGQDLLSLGIPITGELYAIYASERGFIDIKIIVLAPPGNSLKTRLSKRTKPPA